MKIEKKILGLFKTIEYWFEPEPFDTPGYSSVSFRQCVHRKDLPGFKRLPYTTQIINLNQDIDQIWHNIHPKSGRYKINRSKKEGVKIIQSKDLTKFFDMHEKFVLAKNIEEAGYEKHQLTDNSALFLAFYDTELIAGQLYIESGNAICLLLASSIRLNTSNKLKKIISYANKHLTWEAILYAKNKNISEFNFGGFYTGSKHDQDKLNINTSKLSFGGEIIEKYNYKKSYNLIYKIAQYVYIKILH